MPYGDKEYSSYYVRISQANNSLYTPKTIGKSYYDEV
jgi:hypothetical protein